MANGKKCAITTGYAPFGEGIPYSLYSVFEKLSYEYTEPTALDKILYLLLGYAMAGEKEVDKDELQIILKHLLVGG